jgi:hypothetical protein
MGTLLRYGLLLKDNKFDEDITEINKEDSKYKQNMNPKGKSSIHMKTVIIPELQARAQYFHDRWRFMKVKSLNVLEYKSQLRASADKELIKKTRKRFVVSEVKIKKRAEIHYYEKVKSIALERSNFIDGLMQYPIIQKFLQDHNELTDLEFQVLIISYCHKWINITDGEYFGYEKTSFALTLNRLKHKGFLDRFTVRLRKGSFVCNKKANDLVLEYCKTNRRLTRKLFKLIDERMANKLWTYAKYNKKELVRINPYEATDLEGFDKATD